MAMEYLFLSVRALGPERQASSLRFSTVKQLYSNKDLLKKKSPELTDLYIPGEDGINM